MKTTNKSQSEEKKSWKIPNDDGDDDVERKARPDSENLIPLSMGGGKPADARLDAVRHTHQQLRVHPLARDLHPGR